LSPRLEAAVKGLVAAGATPKAAALLVAAGYTSVGALKGVAWTAGDAGRQYESAEWRLSVQHACTPATLAEVRSFLSHALEGAPE
jgi:hypothetical protein